MPDTRRADNRYGRVREKRVAHVAGHAQSSRGADSGTTDDGVEASVGKQTERWYLGAKETGESFPPVYCGGSGSGPNLSEGRPVTDPNTVPAIYCLPGTERD